MPISVRFAGDGTPLGKPCASASFRVFVEGGLEAGYAISAEGLRIIRDDLEARRRFIACATSFRAWLEHWRYVAEGGFPRTLAATIWEGQEQALQAMLAHPFLFALKGRQVGLTTLACAYDAWHVRFGPPNATAHLFSKGEADALELLEQVVYGLDNLPVFLRLPSTRSTVRIRRYDAGPQDTRTLRAFPADRTTGRGHTCTHAHIDEWSAMQWPARTLASILPSVAQAIGSCHILTTECVGPESESAVYYRRCEAGEGKHVPLFVSSLARADRDEAWLEGQRRSMHPAAFNREFPTTAEQALEAAGERYFEARDVELADVDANGLGPARSYRDRRGRERPFRYAVGVDVGFRQDATAIVVLELTDEGHDVVDYQYLTGASPAEVGRQLEHVGTRYPNCLILVEDTGPGYVVRDDLDLPAERVQGFSTGALSKERILDNLYAELRAQTIKWPHDDCPELTREMYACRAGRHTGDTVIGLALAVPFKPDPRFDSPEWRADLLLRQRSTKASVRRLAEETPGRSRSAIAEDLALARREEAIARRQAVSAAKARSEGGTRPDEPEKPGYQVWLQDHRAGAVVRPDGSHVPVGPRYRDDDVTALRQRNEERRMIADANVLAGLTPDGFALLQTPLGQTNYDPLMPDDVARARAYLRDDVERFLLDSGEDPLVASAAAEERAREWEPARGPR